MFALEKVTLFNAKLQRLGGGGGGFLLLKLVDYQDLGKFDLQRLLID